MKLLAQTQKTAEERLQQQEAARRAKETAVEQAAVTLNEMRDKFYEELIEFDGIMTPYGRTFRGAELYEAVPGGTIILNCSGGPPTRPVERVLWARFALSIHRGPHSLHGKAPLLLVVPDIEVKVYPPPNSFHPTTPEEAKFSLRRYDKEAVDKFYQGVTKALSEWLVILNPDEDED